MCFFFQFFCIWFELSLIGFEDYEKETIKDLGDMDDWKTEITTVVRACSVFLPIMLDTLIVQ